MNESFQYLEPWVSVSDEVDHLESELRREISPEHPLFKFKTRALARRVDCDDILFEIESHESPFAVVHLTFSGSRENDSHWPYTKFFQSFQEWIDSCMMLDHQDYIE
jgi:hypothetical protein